MGNCRVVETKYSVHYGICDDDNDFPGGHKITYCFSSADGHRIVERFFTNEYCDGQPLRQESTHGCRMNEQSTAWVRYDCQAWNRGDLRSANEEGKENGNLNADVAVLMTALSIVCIIGIIVGYLLQRKKRKSAENVLLCDAN